MPQLDDIIPEAMDNYIGVEIIIFYGDTVSQGSFRHRKRDVEVNTIVRSNRNPILDTRTYELEFKYGSMSNYYEFFIAESMYAQCDEEVQKYLLFGSILDHKTNGNSLSVEDQYVVVRGQSLKRKTTKKLALVCPMEGWDNNMGQDIRPQGIPSH